MTTIEEWAKSFLDSAEHQTCEDCGRDAPPIEAGFAGWEPIDCDGLVCPDCWPARTGK